MKIVKSLLYTVFAFFILYLFARILQHPHEEYYVSIIPIFIQTGMHQMMSEKRSLTCYTKFQDGIKGFFNPNQQLLLFERGLFSL